MIRLFPLFIFSVAFLFPFTTFAQHGDCESARSITEKGIYEFNPTDSGEVEDNLGFMCVNEITNNIPSELGPSYWFELDITASGTLFFSISSASEFDDIDFVVYQAEDVDNVCDGKMGIRCMFS